jgi:hypothetical protein
MKNFQIGGKQYILKSFGGSRTSRKSTGGNRYTVVANNQMASEWWQSIEWQPWNGK